MISTLPLMYCVRCRSKRVPARLERVKMKNGKDAYKGNCNVCDCVMFKIGIGEFFNEPKESKEFPLLEYLRFNEIKEG